MQKILSNILPFLLGALFIMLPFHAFGITSVNHFFLEVGTPAPVFLKMWKEVFILIIFVMIIVLGFIGGHCVHQKKSDTEPVEVEEISGFEKINLLIQKCILFFKKLDILDVLIIGFTLLSFLISALHFPENSLHNVIYGIKYSLFPLWIFFMFRRISEEVSQKFFKVFQSLFPVFSGIVIFSGLILFFLAQVIPEFFAFFGYSTDHSFHSLFQPLAYCQQISFTEICRAQGVFSGPNQMGAYLIFVVTGIFGFCVGVITNRLNINQSDVCNTSLRKIQKIFFLILFFSGIVLLVLTFSRSAWIGGLGAGMFFLLFYSVGNANFRSLRNKVLTGIVLIPVVCVGLFSLIFPEISDKIINRASSSSQHYELSLEAAKNVIENPFGQGLGTAGAASKYESEAGQKEVGIIPENWYLQIGIEAGFLGMLFWLGIIFVVMKKLVQQNDTKKNVGNSHGCSLRDQNNFPLALAASFFGISLMGLFLHSWESSALAYTVWGLAGVILRKQ